MSTVYLASRDERRFPKHQSEEEQLRALRGLTYDYDSFMGEAGQLVELRDAIENEGELLPGRTGDESLRLVNEAIDANQRLMSYELKRQTRITVRRFGMAAASLALISAIGLVWQFGPSLFR